MLNRSALVILAGAMMSLAGCGTTGNSPALMTVGYAPAATTAADSAGRLLAPLDGGLIAGEIGSGLTPRARTAALQAEYNALERLPAGQAEEWSLDGVRGQVTAGQPYRVGSQDCRQYDQTVYKADSADTARGAACRNDDGSWTLLN